MVSIWSFAIRVHVSTGPTPTGSPTGGPFPLTSSLSKLVLRKAKGGEPYAFPLCPRLPPLTSHYDKQHILRDQFSSDKLAIRMGSASGNLATSFGCLGHVSWWCDVCNYQQEPLHRAGTVVETLLYGNITSWILWASAISVRYSIVFLYIIWWSLSGWKILFVHNDAPVFNLCCMPLVLFNRGRGQFSPLYVASHIALARYASMAVGVSK